jgi:GGDEF domain-containing protein
LSFDPLAVERDASARLLHESRTLSIQDPFAGAALRVRRELGDAASYEPLIEYWAARAPGSPRGHMRYRWDLSHRRGVAPPSYAGPATAWRAWRPNEQSRVDKDPFLFEERLATPILLVENCSVLLECGANDLAQELLREAVPTFRRDFAEHVQALEPWLDTFALARLVEGDAGRRFAYPVAVAIAACYAALERSEDGAVVGIRFPFHEKPLVSATAYLATGLLGLGMELELAARLASYVSRARRSDGTWGDQSDAGDVVATLAATEILQRVDPSFDAMPTLRTLADMRDETGLWHALGPEALWISARILQLFATARRPFHERFQWPHLSDHMKDRKTALPAFAFFSELTELFGAFAGLSSAPLDVAFIDLIGFRAFNNRFGQASGDEVLRAFAEELQRISSVAVIRDGGDEFLVIGAPTRANLGQDLDAFRKLWPARFRHRFGDDVPAVAPRIVVGHTTGKRLAPARETAGRAITELKDAANVGPEGIQKDLGGI